MIVDLTPSDDQRMIEDGVRGFLQDRLPVERLREAKNHGGAAERALWQELSGLGLFALGCAEQDGGLGLGLAEEALVARALGLFLVSPLVLAQLAAPHFAADADLRAALIAGTARAAFANSLGDGSAHLIDGDEAEHILLLSPEGAVLLPRNALGEALVTAGMDETISLAKASVPSTVPARCTYADRTSLLIAAYLTGIAQAATTMAVAYAKTREQFGQPIGAFQAIKHQCADMAARAAAAEAQSFYTAVGCGNGLDDASEIAAARMLAARAAIDNARANIQIHGGMGFTAECDAHLYLKRALVEMPDGIFVGHADAAVQLDGVAADKQRRLRHPRLDRRRHQRACRRIAVHKCPKPAQHDRAGLFGFDEHVGNAVAQRLEIADEMAILLAGEQVIAGDFLRPLHRSEHFGTFENEAPVERGIQRWGTCLRTGEHCRAGALQPQVTSRAIIECGV